MRILIITMAALGAYALGYAVAAFILLRAFRREGRDPGRAYKVAMLSWVAVAIIAGIAVVSFISRMGEYMDERSK